MYKKLLFLVLVSPSTQPSIPNALMQDVTARHLQMH
jgi:hypothetical protein